MMQFEAVMTVELKIRAPYPIDGQRIGVNIESGHWLDFANL